MSSSGFTTTSLKALYAAFNSSTTYNSITYATDSNGNPLMLPLDSFLGNPNYSGFNVTPEALPGMYNAYAFNLNKFINDASNNNIPNLQLGHINLRITITIADGNVFFDSSKGNKNTYSNFINKSINENHATRHYIQQAMHSKNGIGWETKWSSSTKGLETYYSVRVGMSEFGIIGVITFSYSNVY